MADKFKKMTFSEHFEELRSRLLFCVIGVVGAFVVCFCFKDFLVSLVLSPYESLRMAKAADEDGEQLRRLVFISPTEKFLFYLKVCFLFAIFVDAPIILYQMWRFIAAGLYGHERRPVMRVVPISVGLFLVGMLFGYMVLFPIGLKFLIEFGDPELLEASISVSRYFSLFALLILVMGFIFQTPLIMVVTTSVGFTSPEFFSSKRKYFILGSFVASALLTPPDWITQILLAGPLIVLFEIGIILCRGARKNKRRKKTGKHADPQLDVQENSSGDKPEKQASDQSGKE